MTQYHISASVLSADFAQLGKEVEAVLDCGADRIHFDAMDNHFVPNLTIGPDVCQAIHKTVPGALIDVHLMLKGVDDIIPAFAQAGAHSITVHPEGTTHLDRTLQLIKKCGIKSGVAFNPATPLNHLKYVVDKVDIVLIMSVNPGFGGQKFIHSALHKITEAHGIIELSRKDISLAVDGGVNAENIKEIANAGADTFVAGSAIFHNSSYKNSIDALKKALGA